MAFVLPPTPDIVFTDLNQIADLMGATGLALRLEDNLEHASTIASLSATNPIVVTCDVAHNLSSGAVVQVIGTGSNSGANGIWNVTVTSATEFELDGSVASGAMANGVWLEIDGSNGTVNQAVNVATAWVKRYCQSLYEAAQLALSWSVVTWATIKACHWICARRNNPIPTSLNNLYLEAMDELERVRAGQLLIEDIFYRNEIFPSWLNVRRDLRWTYKTMRVETSTSGRMPPQYPQKQDMSDAIVGPTEPNTFT